MTERPTPVYLDAQTAEILARCYRGQAKRDVIARAVRLLAAADGHLDPSGRIKTGRETRRSPQ
ncbi:hypothetical protein [Streptomyces spectabilis]|uniref:Uncharacterized protein n=1 Tax=Streptomyces spectabilis TaxID=68270 RepID=A0A5P2X650_STRST|nr:hypothetical protein [Streptomyces spectabilis]MBB5108357.1 hypothetical protein [Streptomyces spectabilis]MCI3901114.1 hypothetical protein [Streptomyces spectabilis]QEV58605.1 hypothetical protein CP982_07640 [Streptomyces spectabilis]GGV46046.1 hypothetical protein GCM10010245_72190 [Streptomyces spectabilis]